MARQRTGFIVTNVCAVIHYTDANGQHHKITKAAKAQAADSQKNLTEAQRQVVRTRLGKQIIRDTILELKNAGATNCKGASESRLFARARADSLRESATPTTRANGMTLCGRLSLALMRGI